MFLTSFCVCVYVYGKYSRSLVVAMIKILHKNMTIALNLHLYVAVNSFHLNKLKHYEIL